MNLRIAASGRPPLSRLLLAMVLAGSAAAASVDDPSAEAKRLASAGQLRKAVETINGFLTQNPGYSQANRLLLELARYQDDLGELDAAKTTYQKLLDADPKGKDRGAILLALAKLHAAGEDWTAAVKTAEQALSAGVGLEQEDATLSCASYYLRLKRWEDAAAKYNLVARSGTAKAADAAVMLCMTWISAGRIEDAAAAVGDFAKSFPQDERAPDILVSYATLQVQKGKFDTAATLAGQVRERWPKSDQANVAAFILARCKEAAKDLDGALKIYEALAKIDGANQRDLAAEAAWQAAELVNQQKPRSPEAVDRYEIALGQLRESEQNDRHRQQMIQCLVRLGDVTFQAGKYAVALDYYMQLRELAPNSAALFRITQCLQALGDTAPKINLRLKDDELKRLKAIASEKPGTAEAAAADVTIANDRLARLLEGRNDPSVCAEDFAKILSTYSAEILAADGLGLNCLINQGAAHGGSPNPAQWPKGIEAYQKALEQAKPGSSERSLILESLAQLYDRTGAPEKSRPLYKEMLDEAKRRAKEAAGDAKLAAKSQARVGELYGIIASRPIPNALDQMIAETAAVVESAPPLSDEARIARYYLGEYHLMKKDFGRAATAWEEYLRIFGPDRDAEGNFKKPFEMKEPEKAQQYFSAAQRVANAWYLQSNQAKMLAAYRWIVANLNVRDNPFLGEASYFVAQSQATSEGLKTVPGKKTAAEAMWRGVVADTVDPAALPKGFRPWAGSTNPDNARYVLAAAQKAGLWWSQAGEHDLAIMAFQAPLTLHADRWHGMKGKKDTANPLLPVLDELMPPARYLLGQEYVTQRDYSRLLTAWTPYFDQLREDPYRVAALRKLGTVIGTLEQYQDAVTAFTILLDEYGTNPVDPKTNAPVPIPPAQRLRTEGSWNGIRQSVPAELDQGVVRFNLGYFHWSHKAYAPCISSLDAFATDPALAKNTKRDQALYMRAQSMQRLERYADADKALKQLVQEHPKFSQIVEAHQRLAACQMEAEDWPGLAVTVRTFIATWPNDAWRPHIDLYAAVAEVVVGNRASGLKTLATIATGDGSNEVKSEAAYQLGRLIAASPKEDQSKTGGWFDHSLRLRPAARTLLAAATSAKARGKPAEARTHLERLLADFGDTTTERLTAARTLLSSLPPSPAKP